MTKVTDFTPEEADLLFGLSYVVAGSSLAAIHVGTLKAIKTAFSLYLIVRDTGQQFPDNECIQTILALKNVRYDHDEVSEKYSINGKTYSVTDKEAAIQVRNSMCEQALGILNEKCQAQEVEEYKRWLLLIASEVMHRAQSHGFLGLGKERADAEVAQALQDFAQVLQLPQ